MYWYASDLYLKDWGGLSDSYPYMHCTRSTKKSEFDVLVCKASVLDRWGGLIGDIEQQRVHSVLWQFQMGGFIISFTWVNLKI